MLRVFVGALIVFVVTLGSLPRSGQGLSAQVGQPSVQSSPASSREDRSLLSGHVTGAGVPLFGAEVTVASPTLREPLTVRTDAKGYYELTDLRPGSYTVIAAASGYVSLRYGQTTPSSLWRSVNLTGTVARGIDINLLPTASISGRVIDENGRPAAGALVKLLRERSSRGRATLEPVLSPQSTDSDGYFRVGNLSAGRYSVLATHRKRWSIPKEQSKFGYGPTWYPSVTDAELAGRFDVSWGQSVEGIDITLQPARLLRVTGHVSDSRGQPAANASIVVLQAQRSRAGASMEAFASTTTSVDGSYLLEDLPPGRYLVDVGIGGQDDRNQRASVALDAREDLANFEIRTSSPWRLSAKVVTATKAPLAAALARAALIAEPDLREGVYSSRARSIPIDPDGTVSAAGFFGPHYIRPLSLREGWALESIEIDGRDVTDEPLDPGPGGEIRNATITLGNGAAAIAGSLVNKRGETVNYGAIVAFATDRRHWHLNTRFIKATQVDGAGNFRIDGLPAGSYYVATGDVTDVEQITDPQFLSELERDAMSVTLVQAELKQLRLTRRR